MSEQHKQIKKHAVLLDFMKIICQGRLLVVLSFGYIDLPDDSTQGTMYSHVYLNSMAFSETLQPPTRIAESHNS